MKKIVLLFSFFLLLSCSNSDDDVSSSSTDFNPPAWIQGTWALQDDTSNDAVVFNFTKADFCMTASYAKQCQKELVDQIKKKWWYSKSNRNDNSQYLHCRNNLLCWTVSNLFF